MATIILGPQEEFEHSHDGISYTRLLSGSATYIDNSRKIDMVFEESIITPANVSHKIINTGTKECAVECWHGGVKQ
ncbi:MAG TPA: cupin domain-containing protein [Chitinophagaceae bacterium]|nr:cupin domain-containing protein [Chitinophagaceae bacterium]